MARYLAFTVLGRPAAKGRPRFSRSGRPYTPKPTLVYESKVARHCREACELADWRTLEGHVKVSLDIYPKALKAGGEPKRAGDIDNIAKAVLDAMNEIAYLDDDQITHLIVRRKPAIEGGKIRVRVESSA
jgi:crossover junction endodeoxyribonuclease RusA